MDKPDWQRLIHIRSYCEDVESFIERFGRDYNTFLQDRAYLSSVAMCVLQIGELANGLSDEFRKRTNIDMPWHMIRGMRNMLVHSYGEVNEKVLWDTANNDIPKLKAFCDKLLGKEKNRSDIDAR